MGETEDFGDREGGLSFMDFPLGEKRKLISSVR